jgi:hypothetical protein
MGKIFAIIAVFLITESAFAQLSFTKKKTSQPDMHKPTHNEEGFKNVVQVLGKRPKEVVAIFGESDYGQDSRRYVRTRADYLFGQSQDSFIIEYVIATLKGTPIEFKKEKVLDPELLKSLGFVFPQGCRIDTTFGHSRQYKYLDNIEITYSDCLKIEPVRKYEDTSKYYYTMNFSSKGLELGADLSKISVILSKRRN